MKNMIQTVKDEGGNIMWWCFAVKEGRMIIRKDDYLDI